MKEIRTTSTDILFAIGISLMVVGISHILEAQLRFPFCRLFVFLTTGEWVKLPSISLWAKCGLTVVRP